MKISIIGTGYVGLVSGVCLAELGHEILCIDNNPEKIEQMRQAKSPIYEAGLEELMQKNITSKNLSFDSDLKKAVDFAEAIFLCLPTPPKSDGSADLSFILGVATEIGKLITNYKVIVNKSTVPIGTVELVKKTMQQYTNQDFDVVSNPEFLREGTAVKDFLFPDRIVIGSTNQKATEIMTRLYKPLTDQNYPLLVVDTASSEMIKYASNSFLATKISFMNEVANLCERVGADVDKVKTGMGLDPRIGDKFLNAGCGYGGSCFPKDVSALIQIGKEVNHDFEILKAVESVNKKQKIILVEKLQNHFDDLKNLQIAVWGLAFKPGTDDVREAPASDTIKELLNFSAKVTAFDPVATSNFQKFNQDLEIAYVKDMYEALNDADALLILTEWDEFKQADLARIKQNLKNPVIFDGRNIFERESLFEHNLQYFGVGKS